MREDIVKNWANKNDIHITQLQLEKLAKFQAHVIETNNTMNLTAITDSDGFAVKHIIDSLTLLPYIPTGASVIDVGTGAGFPGVVLGIMRPDINLSLLDSLKKRIRFLEASLVMLGLDEVKCIPERAEDWARTSGNVYDICTARAVAKMDKLLKYTLPLVNTNGMLLAMKGPDVNEEVDMAEKVLKKLGGIVKSVDKIEIEDGVWRSVVVVGRL